MDIDLARTFLEIVRTGSFMAAAERLHVTQTTVTARIRNLEAQLGCRLFTRNKRGAAPTEHGERFVVHANRLISAWERARRELPLPQGTQSLLRLGGEISLWNPLLLNWSLLLQQQRPSWALELEVGEWRALHDKLEQGLLDATLAHQPDYWPDIQVELLLEEKLIMVRAKNSDQPYIHIDWGETVRRQHSIALPEYSRAALGTNLGPLGIQFLLHHGGSGYFRTRAVQSYIKDGQFEPVPGAPEFNYPIYLVYHRQRTSPLLLDAVNLLREHIADWDNLEQGRSG